MREAARLRAAERTAEFLLELWLRERTLYSLGSNAWMERRTQEELVKQCGELRDLDQEQLEREIRMGVSLGVNQEDVYGETPSATWAAEQIENGVRHDFKAWLEEQRIGDALERARTKRADKQEAAQTAKQKFMRMLWSTPLEDQVKDQWLERYNASHGVTDS